MRATTCEKWPAGFFAVPLNIRCSRKCASPDLPGVSSAAPTLYQIMWVTTGARWSGMTISSNPFARVKSEILAPVGSAASDGVASAAARTAMPAGKIIRFNDTILEPCNLSWAPHARYRRRHARILQIGSAAGCAASWCCCRPRCRVIPDSYPPWEWRLLADAIGLIRRRRLIARRRLGQRRARRLAGEAGLIPVRLCRTSCSRNWPW